jgi:CHAT domain-containing protein
LLLILGLAACRQSHFNLEKQFQLARGAFERGDLPAALEASRVGLEHAGSADSQSSWRFRVLEAETLIWQGKAKDSLALLDRDIPDSLSTSEEVVQQKRLQGIANTYLQNFPVADAKLKEAESIAANHHPPMLAEIYLAQGTLASFLKEFTTAESKYHEGLRIARNNNLRFAEASASGNLGVLALQRNRYDESIDYSDEVLQIAKELNNVTLVSKLAGNVGWCYYMMGDYERALSNFTEAEAATAKLGMVNDQQYWLTNIGNIHYQQGDFTGAAQYYEKALAIARGLENKSAAASTLGNLATTALETRNYDLAEKYNRESMQTYHDIGDKSAELYPIENDARIAAGRKDYKLAKQLHDRVIHDSGENISLRWEAESKLAELFVEQDNAAQADAEFKRALATIDKARETLKEEHRLSFLGTAQRFYDDYIEFLVSHQRDREALQVAEHSRARTLAEGLGLAKRAAAFHPEQTAQSQHSVILYYWLGAERSYLWAISPSKVALFRLPAAPDIDNKVQNYQKALMGPRDVRETQNSSGQDLYATLVAPAQKMIPASARVIVIPDGSLHGLNFETLLVPYPSARNSERRVGQSTSDASPQLHYWIEDATITNGNSLALLAAPERKMNSRNLLLIGDPVYTGRDFPPLPQAKVELAKVEEHFPSNDRTVVSGDQATAQAYEKSQAGKYAYIHFVAHATSSRTSPLDSGIILSNDGTTTKLYARDIMQQPLRADLVTVAACYGAGTRAYSGEGLVGLSWAFLRAGAHNVIAALWEVNDASTPQLMDNLYSGLGKGKDPATALRDAKLQLLHSDSVFRRPFYWGAFQLYSGS